MLAFPQIIRYSSIDKRSLNVNELRQSWHQEGSICSLATLMTRAGNT